MKHTGGYTHIDINWGSSTQAFLYSYSMRNLLKLEKLEDHVKNFRYCYVTLVQYLCNISMLKHPLHTNY